MSSAGHLMDQDYMNDTLKMAEQFPDFVLGFICQHAISPKPHWINITPGIQYNVSGDALGQNYITPEKAILDQGSDIIIVGRGIISAANPLMEARLYRQNGWLAYQKRIHTNKN